MAPRREWSSGAVERELLRLSGPGRVMPTANEMRAAGMESLASVVSRVGFDEWADRLGLTRAQHDSRRGWEWEEWFATEAAARGATVVRRGRVKAPEDVTVNGRTVNVKMATGAMIAGGHQYSWRISKPAHAVEFYAMIALRDGKPPRPPLIFIIPAADVPLTMLTVRDGPRRFGKRRQWLDRWDLLGIGGAS